MRRKITIQDALEAWRDQRTSEGSLHGHVVPSVLYELLIQPQENGDKEAILNHLSQCQRCLGELKEMAQSIAGATVWDVALPRAAASEVQGPKKIPTDGGKYTVVIRRNLGKKDRGVITLEVAPRYRDDLEGKAVILRDGRGRILLQGKIIDGEISREIEELGAMVPPFLVEADSRDP